MANKITVKDYFMELRALAERANRADLVTFVDSRIAQVEAKNARRSEKPTAKQAENIELMNRIVECMEDGKRYRVSEINKFDFLKDQCEVVYLSRTPEISTTKIKSDLNNK